jgi:hypothetical protein
LEQRMLYHYYRSANLAVLVSCERLPGRSGQRAHNLS